VPSGPSVPEKGLAAFVALSNRRSAPAEKVPRPWARFAGRHPAQPRIPILASRMWCLIPCDHANRTAAAIRSSAPSQRPICPVPYQVVERYSSASSTSEWGKFVAVSHRFSGDENARRDLTFLAGRQDTILKSWRVRRPSIFECGTFLRHFLGTIRAPARADAARAL
jgi:hypothetical protein